MGSGVLSVMTNGMILMLKWFADSWGWGKKYVIICILFDAKDPQI